MRKEASLALKGITQQDEELWFIKDIDLLIEHQGIEQCRLLVLPALREAVQPVIDRQLSNAQQVLEVGCGQGFFANWLAPEWLKGKISSFDINLPLLRENPSRNGNLFRGSVYELPTRSNQFDAVIGYSSFDSFFCLGNALREVGRTLKPKGKVVFFQDLIADLYLEEYEQKSRYSGWKTTDRHFQDLIKDLKEAGFRIPGDVEFLEGAAVERRGAIQKRLGADFAIEKFPLYIVYDRGFVIPIIVRQTPKGRLVLKVEPEGVLTPQSHQDFRNFIVLNHHPKIDFESFRLGDEDVLEWVKLCCLVAEKV